ncbi:hypothetical protein V6N13_089901 [Hibiscus sabdariffa]
MTLCNLTLLIGKPCCYVAVFCSFCSLYIDLQKSKEWHRAQCLLHGQPNKTKTSKGLWLFMTRTPPTVGTTLPRRLEGKLPRKLRGTMSCSWPMSSTSRPAKFPSPIGPLQISPKDVASQLQ